MKYLAGLAGTHVIRINNHEHTDLQEYVGSYCVGENDKLVFKEGTWSRGVYTWYTHVVHTWYTGGAHVVYTWYTRGLHVVYTWSTRGIHVVDVLLLD